MPIPLTPVQSSFSNQELRHIERNYPRFMHKYAEYRSLNIRDYNQHTGLTPERSLNSVQLLAILYKQLHPDKTVIFRHDQITQSNAEVIASGGTIGNTGGEYRIDFRLMRLPSTEDQTNLFPILPEYKGLTIAMTRHTQHFIRFYLSPNKTLFILSSLVDSQLAYDVLCALGLLQSDLRLPIPYLQALAENDLDKLLALYEADAKQLEETRRLEENLTQLTRFTGSIGQTEQRNLESRIQDRRYAISNLRDQIMIYQTEITKLNGQLFELIHRPGEFDSESLIKYFSKHKAVYKAYWTGSTLVLCLLTQLRHFDPDAIDTMLSSSRNNYYNQFPTMARAFRRLLVEQEHKIYLQAQYMLNLEDNRIRVGDNIPALWAPQGVPNTHIYNYSCLGDNEDEINEALKAGLYEAALEQCVLSCASLNFYDSPVAERFGRSMVDQDGMYARPCIEIEPNTPWLTFAEYADRFGREETT